VTFPSAPAPSGSVLASLDRLARLIENIASYGAGLAIFALMVMGAAQIILRSVFNLPIAGYIDIVYLIMPAIALLGAAYSQRLGAHIRMELLVGRLAGRTLWLTEIFGTLVGMAVIGILTLYGWDHFVRSLTLGDTTIDSEYIVWPSKLLVPVAFALWFIRLFIQLIGSIRLFIDPSLDSIGVARFHDAQETAREEIMETFDEDISIQGNDK